MSVGSSSYSRDPHSGEETRSKRPWPSAEDFHDAVQNLATCISDDELKGGQPELNSSHLPMPHAGNFADVYRVFCPVTNNTWAVKFFKREVRNLQERYKAISKTLATSQLSFMVEFRYLDQGVQIRGVWYPILKMRWVEGQSLNQYVMQKLDRPKTLEQLSGLWVTVATDLHNAGIAHADLQHGNVVLVPERKGRRLLLRLIDYDGMFVPTLEGQRSGEVGHPAYQHPRRAKDGIYSADVDRFSHLAICCALRCLSVGGKPLWDRFDNGDNLLFREQDFAKPAESALFQELWAHRDLGVRDLVGHLALATRQPLEQIPLVGQLIQGNEIRPLTVAEQGAVEALLGGSDDSGLYELADIKPRPWPNIKPVATRQAAQELLKKFFDRKSPEQVKQDEQGLLQNASEALQRDRARLEQENVPQDSTGTVACPKCGEIVSFPAKARPQARVRCPMCSEVYLLGEALRKRVQKSSPASAPIVTAPDITEPPRRSTVATPARSWSFGRTISNLWNGGARDTAWGIEIGQHSLKALCCQRQEDGSLTAVGFDYIEHAKILSQPDADPEELIAKALATFTSRNALKNTLVAISAHGQIGFIRFFRPPPVDESKIADIAEYEARQQMPFPLEEVVWKHQIMPGGQVVDRFLLDHEVGLFAIKRNQVVKLMRPFETAKVEISQIQLVPLSLYNYLHYDVLAGNLPLPDEYNSDLHLPWTVALSMGTDTTDLVVSDGFRIWLRNIPLGGNHFTKALTKEFKLTFAKAEHLKRNSQQAEDPKLLFQAMRPVYGDLVTEVQRSLGFFQSIHPKATIKNFMALGNAMNLPGLKQYLAMHLGYEMLEFDFFQRLLGDSVVRSPIFRENQQTFAVCYGLCLQALELVPLQNNLLPQRSSVFDRLFGKKA